MLHGKDFASLLLLFFCTFLGLTGLIDKESQEPNMMGLERQLADVERGEPSD